MVLKENRLIMKNQNEENAVKDTEQQQARSFLRQRYLYLLSTLCGGNIDCQITMFDNTSVQCQVKALDPHFENIVVENLITPLPEPVPKAILRTTDVISMQYTCDYKNIIK